MLSERWRRKSFLRRGCEACIMDITLEKAEATSAMGRELEWKYRLTPDQAAQIAGDFPDLRPKRMHTTYFDTPEGALSARRWTLRLRLEDRKSVCTVKAPLSGPGRGEWETEAACIQDAVPVLCNLGCPAELAELTRSGLVPVCGARFTRHAALLELRDAVVEVALDRGRLTGGGREAPLLELEVEYKSGSEDAAGDYAGGLARRYGLEPEPRSKFRRAKSLAEGGSHG